MMRKLPLFMLLLGLFTTPLSAQVAELNGKTEAPVFNLQELNKQFETITSKMTEENIDLKELDKAIDELSALEDQADTCIDDSTKKIKEIDLQIKQFFGTEEKFPTHVDANYLKDQKTKLTQRLAECRLFKIHSNEAIEAIRDKYLSLQQEITLTRGKNIIQRLTQLPADWRSLKAPNIEKQAFEQLAKPSLYLIPLFLIALGISWQIRRFMHKKCRHRILPNALNALLIFASFFFVSAFIALPKPFADAASNTLYQSILLDTLFFTLCLFFYRYIFLLRRVPSLLQWYGFDVVFLKEIGLTILIIYFIRKIGLDYLALLSAPLNLRQLFENLSLVVSLSAMLYFTYSFYHSHKRMLKRIHHLALLYQAIVLIALALTSLTFIGYTTLAVKTAYFMFALLLISALAILLLYGVNKFFKNLNYNPASRRQLKKLLGYASEPPFFELFILQLIAQVAILLGLFYLFGELIADVKYFISLIFNYMSQGFQIYGIFINPLKFISALFTFAFLILLSRYIATQISHSQQFTEDEEERQVAMASIVLYIGFALSFVMGLLMAGFSFTSLTIIAGALSVGIGLGLQSIVNNFLSGLILLIEKPIKVGDRIKIDDIEGFVKQVRVRSTQIITPSQEDIIIPNSDLITHQVTNYMYSDKNWRVKCEVGVAYGSDVDLVMKLLMDVALAHPDVEKKSNKKPMILFRSFGDSALIFQIWCLIKDVNRKYLVSSELNYAIEKTFREHQISIAFPQRDVHIMFDPKDSEWLKNIGKKNE